MKVQDTEIMDGLAVQEQPVLEPPGYNCSARPRQLTQ